MPTFLAREYGLADDQAAARAGLLILMAGVGMIAGGALADRYGRKMMVVRASGAASILAFLMSFVVSPSQLVALRGQLPDRRPLGRVLQVAPDDEKSRPHVEPAQQRRQPR